VTNRRRFLATCCAGALAGAADPAERLTAEIARRRERWMQFDWKAERDIPAAAATTRPRLWPAAAEWRLRAAALPPGLWRPLETTPYQPPPPGQAGNSGAPGYVLMDLAAAWLATGNEFYAESAVRTLKRVCEYPHWGGNGKPLDTDLHAGVLLMGGGITYDVFRDRLSPADRQFVLDKYALQAKRMHDHHAGRPEVPWEQNHTYIDCGGLWCTAVALYGEAPDAGRWYRLGSRALRRAAYLLNEPDGAFYENIGYWGYGFEEHGLPLLEMFRHVTGEDVFAGFDALKKLKYYLLHTLLPGGRYELNLGDAGPDKVAIFGAGRARCAMVKTAAEYDDPESRFLVRYFSAAGNLAPATDPWTLLYWAPGSAEKDPREFWAQAHHFDDLDLVTARSNWSDQAAHFALRCGPAMGHRMHRIYTSGGLPGWNPGTGHVHPDLNGFVIFDHGRHLAVDTGYTWTKVTREHSTVAIDGAGQVGDGQRWPSYAPFDRFARVASFLSAPGEYLYVRGEAANGYQPELRLARFNRHAIMVCDPDETYFIIQDELRSSVPHRYEWLLIAAEEAVQMGEHRYRVVSGSRALTVHFLGPAGAGFHQEPVKVSGRPKTVGERGHRLSFSIEGRPACDFLAVLTLHASDATGPEVTCTSGAITVATPRWSDLFVPAPSSDTVLESDGRQAMVRLRDGEPTLWSVHNAHRLAFRGAELLSAAEPVSVVAGSRFAVVEGRGRTEISLAAPGGRRVRATIAPGRQEVTYR
jgi:hypothetical protein